MAQAARPSAPNPCAAFRPAPPPPPARRPPGAAARPKDAPCPASSGDRGHSGQCKKAPANGMHKPSGGTYSKPDARVKLIPAEEITYVRHGKPFGRTVGSAKLQKRHCRRSVTPPPSSRTVFLARSTPLTHKAPTPLTHKATTPFTQKAATPLTHKATATLTHKATAPLTHKPTSPLAHKPTSPLAHKPMTPPPPAVSCLSAKRFETNGNSQIVSLKRPSPLCKAIQRGPVASAVSRKESEINPISPSSVHVLPARSSKIPLASKAQPSSKSVSTIDNSKLCSTSNQATLKCQRTKTDADPVVEKEHAVKLSLLSPTSVLSISSTEVLPDTRSRPSSRLNLFDGKCKVASLHPETNMPQSKSPQFTTQGPCVELSNDVESAPPTKSHIRNERQTKQEESVRCNMSSGAPAMLHTKLHKKPDQSKSTTQAPCVELSNDFEAIPSTKSHIRNERQMNQEESISCNMSSGAQAILHKELYKKHYPQESTTPGPCVELSDDLDAVPSAKSHMTNERQTNQEASIRCDMISGAPLFLHTEPCKKTYRPDACWKGKFEVTGELIHTCDELEAHFPLEIFIKVYEASKQMPEVLKLEALPLSHLLPKKFKMAPPDAQDIGLCFISSHQRPNRNFDHLLENVSSRFGLRTDIGTTELLIFSSKLLMEDDQTKDGKLYFCGVFRKHLRKKQYRANNHTDNVDISNASLPKADSYISEYTGMNLDMTQDKYTGNNCEIGMKLDATGVNKPKEIGKIFDTAADKHTERVKCKNSSIKLELTGEEETNGINKCLPMLKTPAANATSNTAPTVSFFTGSCSPVSTGSPCKSATRAPACGDLILDPPPGFPLDVPPPGFTSAQHGLRTGETVESHIDSSTSLVLDSPGDVPPGFTSAHRGLHPKENGVCTLFSEKSAIKFSLNITRPVQTDVPPGFAKLLGVKKEPGLPAFSKATGEITPIGKINEKHDKVDMEVDDSSEERQFPKIKRLSDILGFSSASSSNNASTSSRPGNCSEVCRSAAAVPRASKFQETAPPEIQKLCRKRGLPERSESCVAEATKRFKVNGRIALNGSVDHRTLNSNQAQGNSGKS